MGIVLIASTDRGVVGLEDRGKEGGKRGGGGSVVKKIGKEGGKFRFQREMNP